MTPTNTGAKLTDTQRAKLAYVYIRQSTPGQLVRNTERTTRQYALVERAVALGWPAARVHIIDDDLAKSGTQVEQRFGFQHLLAEISLSRVGLVLSLEAARLARNCADWYRLLELCSIFGTAIADCEVVYDPRQYHDRLLLGLAGMMSEAELHHIRIRLHAGQRHKAARGALRLPLPAGLERLHSGEVVLHPDEEIQARLRLVFAKFQGFGGARAVAQYLRQQHLPLPTRPHQGSPPRAIIWVAAKTNGVLNILQNPAYAGAYVYGKSTTEPARRKPGVAHSGVVRLPADQWAVCLPNTYPAYIPWKQFLTTQQRLRANQYKYREARPGAPRVGHALLQGIVLCGRCGARLWVRYRGARGERPGYVCNANAIELGEPRCQEVNAIDVDPVVESLILQALEPDKLALAIEAFDQLEREVERLDHQWRLRIERARFEAERAKRQYDAVEPENRLVARNLERHWETKLRAVEAVEREYAQWQGHHTTTLSAGDRQEILDLGQNLPTLWHAETTTPADRKRIVRLVVRDVILDRTRMQGQVWLQINWQTGATTQQWVPRHITRYGERTDVERLRQRLHALKATGLHDRAIAARLNTEDFCTGTGGPFTQGIIWSLRKRWGIAVARPVRTRGVQLQWPDGSYTLAGVADAVGVHLRTVHTWVARGMLETRQVYRRGPLKIAVSAEQLRALREYVARVRRLPHATRANHNTREGSAASGNAPGQAVELRQSPRGQQRMARYSHPIPQETGGRKNATQTAVRAPRPSQSDKEAL
jgi:DNA invertase Pin-like site-specific DNA recombinase